MPSKLCSEHSVVVVHRQMYSKLIFHFGQQSCFSSSVQQLGNSERGQAVFQYIIACIQIVLSCICRKTGLRHKRMLLPDTFCAMPETLAKSHGIPVLCRLEGQGLRLPPPTEATAHEKELLVLL